MFRKLRRINQKMRKKDCINLLHEVPRGVLAVLGDDDYPYTVPINFTYDRHIIYFHSAKEGHKVDAIRKHNKVSLSVIDDGNFINPGRDYKTFRSVVVFGRLKEITDEEKLREDLELFASKYRDDWVGIARDIDRNISRVTVFELKIDHISGKIVEEK